LCLLELSTSSTTPNEVLLRGANLFSYQMLFSTHLNHKDGIPVLEPDSGERQVLVCFVKGEGGWVRWGVAEDTIPFSRTMVDIEKLLSSKG
jgi:hypothetical protein